MTGTTFELLESIQHEGPQDLILYHGSRGGIDGPIEPISHARCDFGRGFYMGTDLMQAKSLVSGDDSPYYYKLKFHMSEIPKDKILVLDNKSWLRTVLACRHVSPEFDRLEIARKARKKIEKYDVIVGVINCGEKPTRLRVG